MKSLGLPALFCLASALAAGDELLPQAPAGQLELHGTLGGERFWARLSPPKAEYGNQRVLELVYTPPTAEALGGASLPDCPFLLLDDRLRLVAWNGRDSLAQVLADAHGYRVTREEEAPTPDGKATSPSPRKLNVPGPRGWDERLAPVLLALAWHGGSHGEIPLYDLFAPAPVRSNASWNDAAVTLAGRDHHAVADTAGRLQSLADASGHPILTVTAWITPTP